MKIIKTIFDSCYLIEPRLRNDERGLMEVLFDKSISSLIGGFDITEQRFYKMQKENTFFGIHYLTPGKSKGKLISVIQGSGYDYIVDLREGSPTYKQYETLNLSEKTPQILYVPAGFGHGFLSTEANTIQAFAIDVNDADGASKIVNYKDPEIGLNLPVKDIIISDYDKNAK